MNDAMVYDCDVCGYAPPTDQIPQFSPNFRPCPHESKGRLRWHKKNAPLQEVKRLSAIDITVQHRRASCAETTGMITTSMQLNSFGQFVATATCRECGVVEIVDATPVLSLP